MKSPCCGAPSDYDYATHYRCRTCRGWFSALPVVVRETTMSWVDPRVSFNVYGSRGHVTDIGNRQHDSEQVPLL